MVGHVAVAWDVAATKAAAGDEGGGGRSCHLNFRGGCKMRDRYIGGGGDEHGAEALRVLGVFVSGHNFYVCDFRTKHKICILAYRNLCFCVFVFLLGMLLISYF
jgi:hypothetical protein